MSLLLRKVIYNFSKSPAAFNAVPAALISVPDEFISFALLIMFVLIDGITAIIFVMAVDVFVNDSMMESTLVLIVSTLVAAVVKGVALPTVTPDTNVNRTVTISNVLVLMRTVGMLIAFKRVTINPSAVETGLR